MSEHLDPAAARLADELVASGASHDIADVVAAACNVDYDLVWDHLTDVEEHPCGPVLENPNLPQRSIERVLERVERDYPDRVRVEALMLAAHPNLTPEQRARLERIAETNTIMRRILDNHPGR